MRIVPRGFTSLYIALFAVFTLFGTSITIVGATLPKILADFGWDYGIAGTVIAAGAIGYFLSTYVAGRLFSALGPRYSLALGLVLDCLGLAFFASGPAPVPNLLLYLAVGVGQGFIEVSVNWAVLRMTADAAARLPDGSSAVRKDFDSGRAVSLMHGAFAIGAVTGPFVLGWLLSAGLPWATLYRGISALFGTLLVAVFFLPVQRLGREIRTPAPGSPPSDGEPSEGGGRRTVARHPTYYLGFLALFLYVGVELGISNWAAEYFVTVFGASHASGSFAVSLFWAGLLAGRFGIPAFAAGRDKHAILDALCLILFAASTLLAIAGFAGRAFVIPAWILVLVSGFGCSSIYPVVVSVVGEAFPSDQARAVGFASTGGGFGAFVFPWIMSLVSGSLGIRAGFLFYAVFAGATLFACRALAASRARTPGPGI